MSYIKEQVKSTQRELIATCLIGSQSKLANDLATIIK